MMGASRRAKRSIDAWLLIRIDVDAARLEASQSGCAGIAEAVDCSHGAGGRHSWPRSIARVGDPRAWHEWRHRARGRAPTPPMRRADVTPRGGEPACAWAAPHS